MVVGFFRKINIPLAEVDSDDYLRLQNKDDYPGTGIDMSIVKKRADNYNGHNSVSSFVGKGTIFKIYIPYK